MWYTLGKEIEHKIIVGNEKEQIIDTCNNLDEHQGANESQV